MAKPTSADREREAKALSDLYGSNTTLSHAAFAKKFGLTAGTMVWQLLNNHRPLNLLHAARFASGLGVTIGAFSPRLAKEAALVVKAEASRISLTACEPVPLYPTTTWPFRSITHQRWAGLDDFQRGLVEGQVRAAILEIEAQGAQREKQQP